MWSKRQIYLHKEASKALQEIIDSVLLEIKKNNLDEFQASEYILECFSNHGLISDKDRPIVAYGSNTKNVHYFPQADSSIKLTGESLILIDVWARKKEANAPFADITWMAYFGKDIPGLILENFRHVVVARDLALSNIKKGITKTAFIDSIARNYFKEHKIDSYFKHGTGHSIGTRSPHGKYPHLNSSYNSDLIKNLGYTIEPGLYFDDFGIRSEINFYINDQYELVVTTPIQDEITIIQST